MSSLYLKSSSFYCHPDVLTTIIIPAFVTRNWWDGILHNQTTLFLKTALRAKKSRVVTTIGYYM